MALFGRKQPDPTNVPAEVTTLARHILAELGYESTITPGDTPVDVVLMGADNYGYPLFNLIQLCGSEPRKRWDAIVQEHMRRIVRSRSDQPAESMDLPTLRKQLRARVFPSGIHNEPTDLSYARDLAPGLVYALCVDYPETVLTLPASTIAKLALPLDELFAIGQQNTNSEPVDDISELGDGLFLIEGSSLFTASKIADLEALASLVGPLPNGIVFAVPHRHLIIYAIPKTVQVVKAINTLAGVADRVANDPSAPLPGGGLSSGIYYGFQSTIDLIGGIDQKSGEFRIDGTGRFGDMLNRLPSES